MAEEVRAKAEAAMAATGHAIGIASEGAYGPHPAVPFLPFGRELILWRDAARGLEIVERMADEAPAFDRAEVDGPAAAGPFLARIGFPETAVVVAAADCGTPVAKGLRDREALARAIAAAGGRATLSTDMRAHMNPRRMATIARLAERLAKRLATPCPGCGAPGFGRLRVEAGLPCAVCTAPTAMVAREIHGCAACGAEAARPRPDGLAEADAATCQHCNP